MLLCAARKAAGHLTVNSRLEQKCDTAAELVPTYCCEKAVSAKLKCQRNSSIQLNRSDWTGCKYTDRNEDFYEEKRG